MTNEKNSSYLKKLWKQSIIRKKAHKL